MQSDGGASFCRERIQPVAQTSVAGVAISPVLWGRGVPADSSNGTPGTEEVGLARWMLPVREIKAAVGLPTVRDSMTSLPTDLYT